FRVRSQAREPRLLERHVVVRIEVVEPDDFVPAREQALRRVRADEAGGPCDQDLHRRPSTAVAGNTCFTSYSTCFFLHRRRTPRAPSSRNCRCATATTAASYRPGRTARTGLSPYSCRHALGSAQGS